MTEPTYTDAQIEAQIGYLLACTNPPMSDAANMLRYLLSERQAAMQGQRGEGLEPNGGNLYREHKVMVTSGEFWRCDHGYTGLDGRECIECQAAMQGQGGEVHAAVKDCAADLRKHAKQCHDLPKLADDLRRMANKLERKFAAALQPPQPVRSVSDETRLDWVAMHAYAMRSAHHGQRNAFVWGPHFPVNEAGVIHNLRYSIDAAIAQEKQS